MERYRNEYTAERRACREYMARRDHWSPLVEVEEMLIEAIVWVVRHPLKALGVVAVVAIYWLLAALWMVS